jgi:glycosyltransferase involved in cell wall biosynthesis
MSRILLVENNEDGTVGGSHKIQADLVTRLSREFEPVVLYYQDNLWAERLRAAGLEVHTWDEVRRREKQEYAAGGKVGTLVTLAKAIAFRRRFIREQGIALVHLNNSPFNGLDDWLPAARLAGVPCVVYAMGDAHREPNPFRRWLMRRFNRYFPLSRLVERSLVEDNGISPDRIVLTYPGIDLSVAATQGCRSTDDVRAEFGVGPDGILAVMVGNLREWKGQHVVVQALARLPESARSRLVVLFVGATGTENTEYLDKIEGMIRDAGLDDVVLVAGRRADVPDLLEAADIAIHASIIPEPFGLVVQEAMLHGCAVVAADEGGPAEMLTHECGLMFDTDRPEELTAHLTVLIEDEGRRRKYGAEARSRVRAFDLRRHVELIEEAYRDLLP